MKIEALLRIVLVTVVVIFCSAVAKAQPPETWSKNAVIYEVNVRQYTVEGTFKAFANRLPQLKELGVDILWFMPIYPISQESRKGSLGSYYSVKDYKGVNPEFGNVKDFKVLVRKAHEMGFKVILDWVANHTGRDNVWMTEHPDWYVKDAQGKALAPFDWTDAAKLDYKNAEMRAAMQDAMSYWVKEVGVDGFRCDVAGEVPTDFWNDTRAKLDRIKPVFMLAEADKPELTKKAFHADYNWPLLNVMNDIAKGKKTATDIDKVLAHHDSVFAPASFKMNFVTNHDENSWSGSEYERLGAGVKAFVVLTYTYPGIPLIYTGQEAGLKKRLSFFEKDTVANWKTPVLFGFYKKMNRLKHTQPALSVGKTRGVFIRYATDNPLLYIFERRVKGNKVLVVLNLSDKVLVVKFTKEKPSGIFTDYFGNVKADASRIDGITLSPWKYFIYTNITK